MKPYEVLIIPSSDEDREFANCYNHEEAVKLLMKSKNVTYTITEFDLEVEVDAYIKGYRDGIGYLGDGVCFVKHNDL